MKMYSYIAAAFFAVAAIYWHAHRETLIWLAVIAGGIGWALGWFENDEAKIETFAAGGWGSRRNFRNITRGHKWTTPARLRDFSESQKKLPIHINNFAMWPDEMKELKRSKVPEIKVRTNAITFTKTTLVLGGMGSGKSIFLYQFFGNPAFNRIFVHDMKGAFVQYFYRENKDWILNFFDERHVNWSIFAELETNPQTVVSFVKGVVTSAQGEDGKQDFFSSSAAELIKDWIFEAFYQNQGAPDEILWKIFFKKKVEWEESAAGDKTKQSILATAALAFEIFELMAQHAKKPRWTIKQFLDSKDKYLFMLNIQELSTRLTPYFAGFTAAMASIHLSQEDTEDDLTIYLLDEWYTLNLDTDTARTLLTAIRSKGGCLMIGAIFIRQDNVFAQQLLDSSRAITIIFKVPDGKTLDHVLKRYGDVEYEERRKIKDGNKVKFELSKSKAPFLTTDLIDTMPQYHHLTILDGGIFYLGKTHMNKLPKIAIPFKQIDQARFYSAKYATAGVKNDLTYQQKEEIYNEIKDMDNNAATVWLRERNLKITANALREIFE